MSQPTRVDSWSELLLALPEFDLIDAQVDQPVDDLCAQVRLPRGLQACPSCGVIEVHPVHDWRTHTVRHLPVAGRARTRISEALRSVQQDISFYTAWIDQHDRNVANAYQRLVAETRKVAGKLIHDAWRTTAVLNDSEMNIPDIGPQLASLHEPEVAYLEAVRGRLGRLTSWRRWR